MLGLTPRLRKGRGEEGKRESFGFVSINANRWSSWAYLDPTVKLCKWKAAMVYLDKVMRELP